MRCRNCGHLNPEQNRFCGMCGASLAGQPSAKPEDKTRAVAEQRTVTRADEPKPAPETRAQNVIEPERNVDPWWEDERGGERPVASNVKPVPSPDLKPVATRPVPVETATTVPVAAEPNRRSEKWWVDEQPGDRVQELREPKRDAPPTETPAIQEPATAKKNDKWWVEDNGPTTVGGPSFLGLSSGESTDSGGGYSYLFQEEEERSHAGRWIALVILLIAAGVLYAKWQPIRDFVLNTAISHTKPNAPAAQPSAGADQGTTPASNSAATTTLASSDTPSQPTITTDSPKQDQNKQTGDRLPNGDKDSSPAKADNSASKSDSTASTTDNAPPAAASKAAAEPPAKAAPEPKLPSAPEPKQTAKPQSKQPAQDADDNADENAAADNQSAPAARRGREPQGNAGGELVTTGEKYLYGRGVARSCDQAVSYFNAAAAKQNPQAFSHLGALYATGECVPMDRATAYAYFRRAYAKEPTNHYFEQNLTMLWREMSPDERQRATGTRSSSF